MILHILIAMVAGWLQDHQQQVINYLREENRVLKAQLGARRLRLTETERRRLATLAYPLGRQRLKEVATLATPETLLRRYHRLMAQKFDGSWHRRPPGRPRVTVEPIVLPPRSPNLNAHCEWFVRSIKEEALDQILMLGERSLSYVIQQYLVHYHAERNHQGLDNQLIAPALDSGSHSGQVRRRARLGGLLSHYYRDAA
jgi:Integrase core domain